MTNIDNLTTAGRRLASTVEEPVVFYDQIRGRGNVKKEKEKAFASVIMFNLRPPYPTKIATYPSYPQFQKFGCRRGNTREHVASFHTSMGAHLGDHNLCLSKSQNCSLITHTRGT